MPRVPGPVSTCLPWCRGSSTYGTCFGCRFPPCSSWWQFSRKPTAFPSTWAESETELVSGFSTEYGSFKFGLFFIAEYTHVIVGSGVFTVLFLGGWRLPFITAAFSGGMTGAVLSVMVFCAKTFLVVFFFMWIRWTLPRFRYDQIMKLGWTMMLPLSLLNVIAYAIFLAVWDAI